MNHSTPKPRHLHSTAALLLTTLAASHGALAASVSYSSAINPGAVVDSASRSAVFFDYFHDLDDVTLQSFDSNLGTLNSATVTFSNIHLFYQATAQFVDETWFANTAGEQLLYGLQLEGLLNYSSTIFSTPFSDAYHSCSDSSWSSSDAVCITTISARTINLPVDYEQTFSDTQSLTAFIDTPSVRLGLRQSGTLLTQQIDDPNDNDFVKYRFGELTSGANVSITYDYTPSIIPVPAAAWLFGSALLGLVARKRA